MKTTYVFVLLVSIFNIIPQAFAQTPRKAIINDDYNLAGWHAAANYYHFMARAPVAGTPPSSLGWTCAVAGAGHDDIPGMNWNNWQGGEMIEQAVADNFEIVMFYSRGDASPQIVYDAAIQGCAVFCFHSIPNTHHYYDYGSDAGSPIRGRGPTPSMIVSGGFSDSTGAILAYGPQGEFIDGTVDGGDCVQSHAHSATAARYAKLRDLYPTWNVFDLRQALRQTCTFYAQGWREDGGYGFPKVSNRTGNTFTETTINGKALTNLTLSDLDVGPPMQPTAKVLADGSKVLFRWFNFRQTGFESTVIKINGTIVFEGDASSYVWDSTLDGEVTAEFFTKLENNNISRNALLEPYTSVKFKALLPNETSCARPAWGKLSQNTFSFSVAAQDASRWNVYASEDLENWRLAGGVNLNGTPATFEDATVNNINQRFYRVSDGNCCSRVIGFTRVMAVPGYTLIANQLEAPSISLNGLFTPTSVDGSVLPNGTEISKWNGTGFNTYTFSGGSWSPNGSDTLNSGEGVFIKNPTATSFSVAFAGLVPEGNLTKTLPSGQSYISSVLPQAGGVTSALGYTPVDGDFIHTWNPATQAYTVYEYYQGYGWDPSEPQIGVGMGFSLQTDTAHSWVRLFSPLCP